MEPTRLLSPARPADSDIYVGVITSDFQVRVRWGWMGFDNASWDEKCLPSLLYKAQTRVTDVFRHRADTRVDVNHWRDNTISGYIIGLEAATAQDLPRVQADLTTPRPIDYVLAAFALPKGGYAAEFSRRIFSQYKRIGISIEHGGRKPKRTIGPFVTITDRPWNKDCWMVYRGSDGKYIYPKMMHPRKGPAYPVCLPTSIVLKAKLLLRDAKALAVR